MYPLFPLAVAVIQIQSISNRFVFSFQYSDDVNFIFSVFFSPPASTQLSLLLRFLLFDLTSFFVLISYNLFNLNYRRHIDWNLKPHIFFHLNNGFYLLLDFFFRNEKKIRN